MSKPKDEAPEVEPEAVEVEEPTDEELNGGTINPAGQWIGP